MKKQFLILLQVLGGLTLIALLIGALASCEAQQSESLLFAGEPTVLSVVESATDSAFTGPLPYILPANSVHLGTYDMNGVEGRWGQVGDTYTFIPNEPILPIIHSENDLWPNQPLVLAKKKGFIRRFFDGYKIKGWKVVAWSGMAIAGSLWGAREAYHADNGVFQTKWNVDRYSFFGSHAWERNYEGNRYRNSDGIVNPLKKPEWLNPTRDYWHFSGAIVPTYLMTFSFTIGVSDQPLKFKGVDAVIGTGLGLAASKWTYNFMRY